MSLAEMALGGCSTNAVYVNDDTLHLARAPLNRHQSYDEHKNDK